MTRRKASRRRSRSGSLARAAAGAAVAEAPDWWPEERRALRLPEKLTVSEWADRNVTYPGEVTPKPGPWRTSWVGYLREIQDSIGDPTIERITLMTAARVGKTSALLNSLLYLMSEEPDAAMWVMPRDEDAEEIMLQRLRPIMQASPKLKALMSPRKSDNTLTHLTVEGMTLHLATAGSPASLASKSIRYLFLDEVDKYPQFSGREADPVSLAMVRTLNYPWDRKILMASTPTTRMGLIFREWELSDQRRYWIPCRHCGAYQTLEWTQVGWPEDERDPERIQNLDLAWYACRHCQGRITDGQKRSALRKGVWCPASCTVKPDGRIEGTVTTAHRGYHLSALYSPWAEWSRLAAEWLRCGSSAERRQNFVNSMLGELWEEKVADPAKHGLAHCVADYPKDRVPEGVELLTAGVDVQKLERGLYYSVWGWGRDEQCWLIRAARVLTFEALGRDLFLGTFLHADGRTRLPVQLTCIDARHRPDEVIDLVRQFPGLAVPIEGTELATMQPFGAARRIDRHPVTLAPLEHSVIVLPCNVRVFRDKVGEHLQLGAKTGTYRATHFHRDPLPEFVRHMSSQHKIVERAGRTHQERLVWTYRPGFDRKDFWDTTVYAFAAAHLAGVPQQRSADARNEEQKPVLGRGMADTRERGSRPFGGFRRREQQRQRLRERMR